MWRPWRIGQPAAPFGSSWATFCSIAIAQQTFYRLIDLFLARMKPWIRHPVRCPFVINGDNLKCEAFMCLFIFIERRRSIRPPNLDRNADRASEKDGPNCAFREGFQCQEALDWLVED